MQAREERKAFRVKASWLRFTSGSLIPAVAQVYCAVGKGVPLAIGRRAKPRQEDSLEDGNIPVLVRISMNP